MKLNTTTREEMWAKQHLSATDIDYAVWERDKSMLHQLSKMGRNCTFVVDVYKCKYAYASPNFVDLLGYDSHKIETLIPRLLPLLPSPPILLQPPLKQFG